MPEGLESKYEDFKESDNGFRTLLEKEIERLIECDSKMNKLVNKRSIEESLILTNMSNKCNVALNQLKRPI